MGRAVPLKESVRVTYRDTQLVGGPPGFDLETEVANSGQSLY